MESGQTIAGKYRLNRMIGTGGMASVWSATNIFTEREFAIKFMLPQMARTPEAARRFLLEAKVSARINHPNIIEVIDVGQAEDGSLFLVMELLTGQSLDVAIRRQQPPMLVSDFVVILRDCARALAAAHKSGVVHRDLKPTNIFLHKDRDGNGVAKILDFGVSKILEEEKNTALTVAGTVLGSPLYMSPEQAMGAPGIDGRTDIFAFGSIMFEALTGRRAFDAPNFNALIVTIATQQPLRIDEYGAHLPESIKSIVRDCMVTDKTRRIASFDTIADRLAAALPEVEPASFRLPSADGGAPPSDPDATNALPVMRASERPPAAAESASMVATSPGSPASGPRSGNSAFSTPWATPPGAQPATSRRGPGVGVVLAGGALALFGIIAIVIALASRSGDAQAPTASSAVPAIANVGSMLDAAAAAATPPASEPPVVSIDELPVASGKSAPAASAPKATGHLSVAASPGWCSIAVDGVKQGDTPIAGLALSAGTHRVDCSPPKGKLRSATLTIQDGVTSKYKFALDE
jgi:serine/threonine-protein kinase